MYLRACQADKIVDLVRGMVEMKVSCHPHALIDWSRKLRGAGFAVQAGQIEILGKDMESFRPGFEGEDGRTEGQS